MTSPQPVLVTGASGYVGNRLIPALLADGFHVRALCRDRRKLADRPWIDQVEVIEGDANSPADLGVALHGVQLAFYLVHSMDGAGDLEQRDRLLAQRFVAACEAERVERIVYLGGLHPEGEQLSHHLGSRKEVGEIFLASNVPTTVLQAGVIIGSGSASFEMLRHLAERLPVMTPPKWLLNRIQPIAIADVVYYLIQGAKLPSTVNRAFDIGGPDVLTYKDMLQRFTALVGLPPRLILPLPVVTPWLASHWVGIVTPVPADIAKPLVGSLIHEVVCKDRDAEHMMGTPPAGLASFDRAVALALSGAGLPTLRDTVHPSDAAIGDPHWAGESLYSTGHETMISAAPERVWVIAQDRGGEYGWHLRGWASKVWARLVGGKTAPVREVARVDGVLCVGDRLDGWVVEANHDGTHMRLRCLANLPGSLWLEHTAVARQAGSISQFETQFTWHPMGLAGHAWWAGMRAPLRRLAAAMNVSIAEEARRGVRRSRPRHARVDVRADGPATQQTPSVTGSIPAQVDAQVDATDPINK